MKWEYFETEEGIVLGSLNSDELETRHFETWDLDEGEKPPLPRIDTGIFQAPEGIRETEPEIVEEEIKEFLKEHLVLQKPDKYIAMTGWIVHTWFKERSRTYPYIYFLGDKGTGKTRALELLEELSHRPIRTTNLSQSSLYRVIDSYDTTYLIDEIRFWRQNERRQMLHDLYGGYREGQRAIRTDESRGSGYKPKAFNLSGPKAFASTDSPDDMLRDRCIVVHMQEAKPSRVQIDKEKAKEIRQKLAYIRLKLLSGDKEEWEEKYREKEVGADNERINEVLRPIKSCLTISENQELVDVLREEIEEDREEEKKTSDEAKWLRRVYEEWDDDLKHGTPEDNIKIYYSNLSRKDENARSVANEVKWFIQRWGLKKERDSDGTYIPWRENEKKLKDLWSKYGIGERRGGRDE